MSDMRIGASPAATGGRGAVGFVRDALASLANPRLWLLAALLAVLLTASNIVILLNPPVPGEPPILFALAAFARVAGLLVLAVAVLRVLTGSTRAPFMPDGAFWLYALTLLVGVALAVGLGAVTGERNDPLTRVLVSFAMTVIGAPLAVWFTALAVARPLAVNPAPWMRGLGRWLPPLILWSLVVVLPLGQLHAAIDMFLIHGAGRWFWPLALVDGPLSAVLAVFSFALAATAYRSVARG
jgi:hypothetical protein